MIKKRITYQNALFKKRSMFFNDLLKYMDTDDFRDILALIMGFGGIIFVLIIGLLGMNECK